MKSGKANIWAGEFISGESVSDAESMNKDTANGSLCLWPGCIRSRVPCVGTSCLIFDGPGERMRNMACNVHMEYLGGHQADECGEAD